MIKTIYKKLSHLFEIFNIPFKLDIFDNKENKEKF